MVAELLGPLNNPYMGELLESGYKESFDYECDMISIIDALNVEGILSGHSLFARRHSLVFQYSFAIPNDYIIREIAKLSPIVEIGAGNGYWSWCLRQLGCKVTAFDDFTWSETTKSKWTSVRIGNHKKLRNRPPDETLFLCWPPYQSPMAYDCLRTFVGDRVVFIGEWDGGCTADDDFFRLLADEWTEVQMVRIPVWVIWGIHDRAFFFERKAPKERRRREVPWRRKKVKLLSA